MSLVVLCLFLLRVSDSFVGRAVPQIVLNVQRGAARQTLRRDYVIGTAVARCTLPVYFWGYRGNVLGIEPSRESACPQASACPLS